MHQSGLIKAARIEGMGVSKILMLAQTARELRAVGRRVIDLSAGQPDFDTPLNIREAVDLAMQRGETRYTALAGTPVLKAAICEKFRRDNGIAFEPEEIMAGAGAKQLLFNAMMATLDPGDEVILPTPCWLSYFDIVRIAGGEPIGLPASLESRYKLSPDQLRASITAKSRWVLFNSPCNPSGAVYSADELGQLLDVVADYPNLWVIADDVYEHIRFTEGQFVTPLTVRPAMRDRVLTVNAVSKAYAMTGWRLGYCAGPPDLISAMSVVQSQSTSNPSSISQAAAAEALTGSQDFLVTAQETYRNRRNLMIEGLSLIDGFECASPEGSFFVFARIAGLLGLKTPDGACIADDNALAAFLLEQADVVTVPGSEFGLPGHIRLSFAVSDNEITEALALLQSATEKLTAE